MARAATTDAQGRYRVEELIPARYTLRIVYRGFAPFERSNIEVVSGRSLTVNARLQIQSELAKVNVTDTGSEVGVDPSQNAGQVVLRGSDLDSFSDDPEDLATELQMLAGPSAGPDEAQIFIDGFSDGVMPPKASIREIRVNQNPFSAEYDRVGFGRVEVFTKPGSDKYHGQASFDFGNRALTARNPYLTGPIVPNYRQENFAGNFGGPLSKKASFFIDVDRRITDDNSLLNYTTLDSSFNPVFVSSALAAPSRRFGINPRVDYAITTNDTVTLRYSPRVGFAWAPGGGNRKTVIRAGGGIFYDRFTSNLLANAALLNGINQTQYIIRNPLFYPNIPDPTTLAAISAQPGGTGTNIRYQVDADLQVPYLLQAAIGIERQLPHGVSVAVNYTTSHGVHELLTRDINAPLPTAFNSSGQAIGPRPYGAAAGDIYQYKGSGVFRQNQLITSVNAKIHSKFSLFGYYVYNRAMSDTDGSGTMPTDPYNLGIDYGRAAFDFHHRAFVSATTTLPFRIRLAPFIYLSRVSVQRDIGRRHQQRWQSQR